MLLGFLPLRPFIETLLADFLSNSWAKLYISGYYLLVVLFCSFRLSVLLYAYTFYKEDHSAYIFAMEDDSQKMDTSTNALKGIQI